MQLSWAKPGNPREGGKAGTNRREEERGRRRGSRAKPGNQLVFPMWKLSSHGCHIGIQDGRHIIRHAVSHDRHMSLTLSVVTEKVVISPFRSDGSHIQFHDDGCIAGPFQCR